MSLMAYQKVSDFPVHVPLLHISKPPRFQTLSVVHVQFDQSVDRHSDQFCFSGVAELDHEVVNSMFWECLPRPDVLKFGFRRSELFDVSVSIGHSLLQWLLVSCSPHVLRRDVLVDIEVVRKFHCSRLPRWCSILISIRWNQNISS